MYRKFSANQTTHKLPLVLGIASRLRMLCIVKRGRKVHGLEMMIMMMMKIYIRM